MSETSWGWRSKLEGVQRSVEGARRPDHLVGQGPAVASSAHGQAWALPEVLRCGYPVLPDHQVIAWPDAGPGAVATASGRSFLGCSRLQHRVPQAKELGRAGALQG